ncbi:hypothetical protein E2C01_067255 [Portunus trituberculatus]|uniref:Uncharacterized protein n=1 Tax=Portunus trituberculatus TaxID=210409 RepID=A0A5B7HJB0_PORTR|nr:hypothetical protein [Portunus trituberculatus]
MAAAGGTFTPLRDKTPACGDLSFAVLGGRKGPLEVGYAFSNTSVSLTSILHTLPSFTVRSFPTLFLTAHLFDSFVISVLLFSHTCPAACVSGIQCWAGRAREAKCNTGNSDNTPPVERHCRDRSPPPGPPSTNEARDVLLMGGRRSFVGEIVLCSPHLKGT